jgi:hypothetical protein
MLVLPEAAVVMGFIQLMVKEGSAARSMQQGAEPEVGRQRPLFSSK